MPVQEVVETEEPLSEADVAAAEASLGISLPDAYRRWLLRYNGGSPTPNRFRYKDETGPYTDSSVDWFLAIGHGPMSNRLGTVFHTFKGKGRARVPDELLPIARDPGGNLICIGVTEPQLGRVWFWDHEEESDPDEASGKPTYENCHLIADSFEEFIEGLH